MKWREYVVSEFVADHTHLASTPSKTHLFRSHRKISLAHKFMADIADDSGIDPKETLELMSRQAGGRENLGFIAEDYRNYLRTKRTIEMKSGDTGGVLEYLQKKQSNDPSFTYAIQVDVDDLITNIFWADAKMKVDYDYFGDVLSFDTTYRKNKEGRPFAMFVGVNNHKQTLIFGAALLYDETAETFMWLFDSFANTMSGKKPKTILTDQDAAMAKALASQWPDSHHRLCIWHIYQNAAKHLKCVFEEFKDFAKDFSSIIYDYEYVEEFKVAWQKMLEKYKLEDNEWLSRLYSVKEKWALVYGRENFSADITTTQRSESMNNVIKRYVSYKHDLLRVFFHFQRLVDIRRYKELDADFKTSQTSPALPFPCQILKNAVKVYTPAVLKWFQSELCKAHDCTFKLFGEIGSMRIYELTDHGKPLQHTVTFDSADNTITCSCKKFEFAGILCSHALKIFSVNDVKIIPSQYILKKWRKDIKDQAPQMSAPNANNDDDRKGKISRRYRDLARLHTELATIAAESDEAYEIASNALHKALADVKTCLRTCQNPPENNSVINNPTHEVYADDFGDHIVKGIKTKERIVRKKDSIRPKNALEKLIKRKRPKKGGDTSTRQQKEPQIDSLNVTSQSVDSMRNYASPNQVNEQISGYTLHNGIQMPNHLALQPQFNPLFFPPRMQFTSPVLHPNMQFISPYQHVQSLGGSNANVSYQQESMITYQQPLTENWNRVPSISAVSTEEHDLMNKSQDEL